VNVAITELRRRPGRFVAATVILSLLASLLLLLGGLLDGLLAGATGAVAAQRAEVVVYSSTSERSLARSRITSEQRRAVEVADGVEGVGGIGVAQLGARVPGNGPRELAAVALFGYERPPAGVGEPPREGQAYADRRLEAEGVEVGQSLELGPARTPVEVVGWVDHLPYSGQGSLWASPSTWRTAVAANRPDARVGADDVQALVVRVADGADPRTVARSIDRATSGETESLLLDEAVDAIPGVSEQRSTFNQIIGVTVAIAVVVVALFFALLTVERSGLYGVFKAIGVTNARLFGGIVVQAVVVTAMASAIATVLAVGLDLALPIGSLPFSLRPARVVTSVALLLGAAVLGCAFTLRRILRIDPASAIGSST
jgi:putative ABC transport system permease protein